MKNVARWYYSVLKNLQSVYTENNIIFTFDIKSKLNQVFKIKGFKLTASVTFLLTGFVFMSTTASTCLNEHEASCW